MADEWQWDETLYAGSAPHYSVGRMPYPPVVAETLREALGLDGSGRLLDVGCGPGSLTTVLAPLFEAAVGVDADAGMLAEAARRCAGITWVRSRAEELPADLGTFRVVTFAQSFHWMNQAVVADRVRGLLEPNALVREYLGPVRRAGRSTLPGGTRADEETTMRRAGYRGPTRLEVGGDHIVHRSVDQLVSAVFSLSSSTPHLFGDALPAFEADLRRILRDGPFTERTHPIALVIWKP